MTLRRYVFIILLPVLSIFAGTGCDKTTAEPKEGPDVVVERFYNYISEAKLRGGGTPVREAFKLISAERSQLVPEQFMAVIQKYPPGFSVELTNTEIHENSAVVSISYDMPSMFGKYAVNSKIPLSLDEASNTWKIDFTGETYGVDSESL